MITDLQAGARVEAQLGRPAQDRLEAAVTLEAWGGVRPALALQMRVPVAPSRSTSAARTDAVNPDAGRETLGVVVSVLASAVWLLPLALVLNAGAISSGVRLALPLSLALQAALRRLLVESGPGALRRHPVVCAGLTLLTLAGVAAPWFHRGIGLALVVLWASGLLLARQGWALAYLVSACVGGSLLLAGLPALACATGLTILLGALVAAAVVIGEPADRRPPQFRLVLLGGLIGLTTGLFLVTAPGINRLDGLWPTAAAVPAVIGGLWFARHADRLWLRLPAALAAPLTAARDLSAARRVVAGTVLGALARLVLTTAVLGGALLAAASRGGAPLDALADLAVAFGAFAVLGGALGLLDALNRPMHALVTGLVAVALADGLPQVTTVLGQTPATPLLVGAAAAMSTTILLLVHLFREPDHATAALV